MFYIYFIGKLLGENFEEDYSDIGSGEKIDWTSELGYGNLGKR